MKSNKFLSYITIILIFLATISFSIALPILFRPFYYYQINSLSLTKKTGFIFETIKRAYDEMLNYCLGLSSTYSCGDLRYSIEGANHFKDCRFLFILDLSILAISIILLILIFVLNKKGIIKLKKFKHNYSYYSAISILVIAIILLLLVLPDFDAAFTVFHKLFFPGKSNWIFDPVDDQIILILPDRFFINCAILIVVTIVVICTIFIIKEYYDHYHYKTKDAN